MYRYIPRESCSQFDSLPLTYLYRQVLAPDDGGRWHSRLRERARDALRGRRQGLRQHRGGGRPLRALAPRGALRAPVRCPRDRRPGVACRQRQARLASRDAQRKEADGEGRRGVGEGRGGARRGGDPPHVVRLRRLPLGLRLPPPRRRVERRLLPRHRQRRLRLAAAHGRRAQRGRRRRPRGLHLPLRRLHCARGEARGAAPHGGGVRRRRARPRAARRAALPRRRRRRALRVEAVHRARRRGRRDERRGAREARRPRRGGARAGRGRRRRGAKRRARRAAPRGALPRRRRPR